ncbi:MAG: ferritin family protein [Bacillaceae bacterium]
MDMYVNDYEAYYRQANKFVGELEQALNGEYSAIQFYTKLATLAQNEKERKQIEEIREDEKRHYAEFAQIYYNLTGMQFQPKITEEMPTQYMKGLKYAIEDEQKTVDFYLEISDEPTIGYSKEVFKRAAADEQNHAVWFLYFYTKNKR